MALHGWIHQPRGEDGYLLLHVAAPPPDRSTRVAKDVTLVLDESGSMEGQALDNGKLAARQIVDRLDAGDRVNVVLFDDRVESLFGAPKPVSADVRAKARRFIDGAGNGGATDIALALKTALTQTGRRRATQDDPAAHRRAIGARRRVRSGRDRPQGRAALHHRASVPRSTTPRSNASPPASAAATRRSPRPASFPSASPSSSIACRRRSSSASSSSPSGPTLLRKYPDTLPDLFAGDELVIAARVQGNGSLTVRLRGTTRSGARTLEHTLRIPKEVQRPWVGAQWARARIGDLLTRLELETTDREERIDEVTRLGVVYDIVTPYTSFLAIPESELTERTRELLEQGRSGQLDRMVRMEEFRNIPVGSATSRDFTSVVESSATASPDSAGISLAGGPTAEPRYTVEGAPPMRRAGCAHCALDDDAPSNGAQWLLVVIVLVARPRSHVRGRAR